MEEGLVPAEIPPDPGGDLVQDGPVDTGIKQGPGPLKTTPPSPGDSSGSESEDCLSRGKRRRPSDSGSSGAEGVASQTPLKISKIGEGGTTDASAPSSAPASPTKSMTSKTAISVATPRSAAQADKGEVGCPCLLPRRIRRTHLPLPRRRRKDGRRPTSQDRTRRVATAGGRHNRAPGLPPLSTTRSWSTTSVVERPASTSWAHGTVASCWPTRLEPSAP